VSLPRPMARGSQLPPLYLRREPTNDPELGAYCPGVVRFDVVAYRDPAAREPVGRWAWWPAPPRSYRRRVRLDDRNWSAVWIREGGGLADEG
jgi:hypothetical protein